ncbi:MAG: GyrI-like domain-containing protein [Candidatus Saganbacteria bacterium]|nr:GyrI-like domain-containing protein [Candidatus Saganbacteria bacterium]
MKILKWILIVIVVLVLILAGFLAYLGAFSSVKVVEKEMGPYTVVYERFVGPYQETGKVFDKVYKSLAADKIQTTVGIGVYYDDPKTTPADKFRSDCGSAIANKDLAKVKALKKYKIMPIAKKRCLVVEFPMKNMLSYMIGPMKAYPELGKYAAVNKIKVSLVYEVYDMAAHKAYYVMQVKK